MQTNSSLAEWVEARLGDGPLRTRARQWVASWPLLRQVFVAWLVTRLGYVAITYVANTLHLFSVGPGRSGLIYTWLRWDAWFYYGISRVGYEQALWANFFPLYPGLLSVVTRVLGDGSGPVPPAPPDKVRMLAALGLTNLALLVALYVIARLAELERGPGDDRAGIRAVWITLAYPFAMAWTAPLADGLFLALAALTLWMARTGRWYAVAAPAFLAALTKSLAVVLVAPLAWEYARQQGWLQLLRPSWQAVRKLAVGTVVVGAVPAGMCAWFAYCFFRFGDFLLPVHTVFTYFGHVSMPQWTTFAIAIHRLFTLKETGLLLTQLVFLCVFAAVILVSIRRLRVAYTLYMAGLLYLITAAPAINWPYPDLLGGDVRYLASAIPVFLVVAGWCLRRPWLERSVIVTGMMLQGVFTIAFFANSPLP